MKKITQKWMLALALSIASMPVLAVQVATPTKFIPTLTSEDAPLRFFVSIDNANAFSGGQGGYIKDGKVGLMNLQLNLGLIYNVGIGLDVGFGVHGGIQSPYSMFITPDPALKDPFKQYGAMFGADIMVRYLSMFSDMFYGGIQAQVGYNYTDGAPGAPDSFFTTAPPLTATGGGLGQESKGAYNSFIPVVAGIVLGADFAGAASIYLFPAIELGQSGNYENSADKAVAAADLNKGIWKSGVGMQIGVGTAIHTGIGDITIQVTPRMANFSNKYSWGMDLTTGMQFDF